MTLDDILVFRSAQPGRSFETWLFQKPTPLERRSLAAAIAAYAPHWRPGAVVPGRLRRHGPFLYEAKIRIGSPGSRSGSSRAGRRTDVISVFFLWTGTGPILLSGGWETVSDGGMPRNLGLGAARHRLRELRAAEEEGVLCRTLGLYTFEGIKHQCRVGRLIPWDRERRTGLVGFKDVCGLARQEAEARDGIQGLRESILEEDRRRLGLAVLRSRCARDMTQQALAAEMGVRQAVISEIEHGLANPTLATLTALARALGVTLQLG